MNNLRGKWAKTANRNFTEEKTQMTHKIMKRCSISLAVKVHTLKPKWRCLQAHHIHNGKQFDNVRVSQDVEKGNHQIVGETLSSYNNLMK